MKKGLLLILVCVYANGNLYSQNISQLVEAVKQKMAKVHNYEAAGRLKTNVSFLKVPVSDVTVYYKEPDQVKIKSSRGVSFIPKGVMSINTGSLLEGMDYTIIDGGTELVDGIALRIARILPNNENSEVVLSTLYIDPSNLVIIKVKTTTRENGTYELLLSYGKYSSYGLPDKLIFSFNTNDYKLPKGITLDFDNGSTTPPSSKNKARKGRAEINFTRYRINQGLPAEVF